MGLLFVLIFWLIIMLFLSAVTGVGGIILAVIFKAITKKRVRYWAWAIAPGFCIMFFCGLIFFESLAYGIVSDSDIGIGDYGKVNINDEYYLDWVDVPDWNLVGEGITNGEHIKDILELDDKIVVSAGDEYEDATIYRLYEIDTNKKESKYLYSARHTNTLWNKYTKEHNIDRSEVYTCDEYYAKYRKYYLVAAVLFNFILLCLIFMFIGKRLLIKQ